jgi:hypothetical protein
VARAVMNTTQAKVARASRVENVSGNIINDISISTTQHYIRVESVLSHLLTHNISSSNVYLFCFHMHHTAYYGKSYGMIGSMPITIEYFEKSGKGSKGSKGYSSKGSKAYGSKGSKGYGTSKGSKGYGTYYTEHVDVEGDSGDYTSDWEGGRF